MKFAIIALVTLVVSGALAALPIRAGIEPGGLSSGLESIDSCFTCHDPMSGASANNCMSCHSLDEIGVNSGSPIPPFHEALENTDCMGCHWLHASARSQQTTQPFQHDFLSAAFRSDCVYCHEQSRPSDELHQQTDQNCSACHSTDTWAGAEIDHDQYFRFDRHHPSTCSNCHTIAGDFSQYSCYGCHEHSAEDIREEHVEEGIRDFQDCASCHRSGDEPEDHGGDDREHDD